MSQDSVEFATKSLLGWGNRGWMEIIDLILMCCEPGALKTHIMYKCNLNSKQIQQYLDFVLSRKLISKSQDSDDAKRASYKTTDRGIEFMRAYDDLANIFSLQNLGVER